MNIRIGQAWSALNKTMKVWKSNLQNHLNVGFFRPLLKVYCNRTFYFAECWTMTGKMRNRLDGTYTRMLRAVLGVSWKEHKTNKELYSNLPKITDKLKIRRLRFIGHCWRRMDEVDGNLQSFQAVCVVIAILSWLLMRYTGLNVQVAVEACDTTSTTSDHDHHDENSLKGGIPLFTLMRQILGQRSFVCIVAITFFQDFHKAFCGNFFLIFVEHLIGSDVLPAIMYSLLTGSVFLLPRILVLAASPLVAKFGSYKLILWSFYIKVSLPAVVFLAGRDNIWVLYLFLIIDNCLPSAAAPLFKLSVSDFIDDDWEKYKRNAPVSSTIFGTKALFTKPALSLAPMMVVHILSWYGYKDIQSNSEDGSTSAGASPQLLDAMFYLICMVPLVMAVLQIVFWTFYPLKTPSCSKNSSMI
ncbi:transmembrane protein 180-like isoform X2 [Montipora capricornis]|uniref:transmembrane protein 180-like isoform X2 n=1 Tax=Montipora capricornis TaxID=246305 RepID=UPI0035F2021F